MAPHGGSYKGEHMALLDGVPDDPNPVSITISFDDYVDGAKLSTMFRAYFDQYKDELGVANHEEYVAYLLLRKLKDEQTIEINNNQRANVKTEIDTAKAALEDVEELVLVKV